MIEMSASEKRLVNIGEPQHSQLIVIVLSVAERNQQTATRSLTF